LHQFLQTFDGETLGRIWAGNITHWDDETITALNPQTDGTNLPHERIVLCYSASPVESVSETFKRGMGVLSPLFESELQAANKSLNQLLLPLAYEGLAFNVTNSTTRISCAQVRVSHGL
jgi:hypothetical protein